jgi:hypothetical protein
MKGINVKQISNNYARCVVTGQYVFFNDSAVPNFVYPKAWAFWRVPAGVDAASFRGQLVGENPAEVASDSEAPASAAS